MTKTMKILTVAGLALAVAPPAFAGGFSDEIVEPVVTVQPAPAPVRGSLPGWVIPAAVLAALVAVAVNNDDNDNEDDTGED